MVALMVGCELEEDRYSFGHRMLLIICSSATVLPSRKVEITRFKLNNHRTRMRAWVGIDIEKVR